jgi:hypothetical protein
MIEDAGTEADAYELTSPRLERSGATRSLETNTSSSLED